VKEGEEERRSMKEGERRVKKRHANQETRFPLQNQTKERKDISSKREK
jgi:hypothetical protein